MPLPVGSPMKGAWFPTCARSWCYAGIKAGMLSLGSPFALVFCLISASVPFWLITSLGHLKLAGRTCNDVRFVYRSLSVDLEVCSRAAATAVSRHHHHHNNNNVSCVGWSSRYSATVLWAFCRQLSQIEPRNGGNRDPPSVTTAATLSEKNRVSRPSVFKPEFTSSRSLTLPSYFMMMWLPWWCGWHDDWDDDVVAMMVRKLAMTIVRNSEVS